MKERLALYRISAIAPAATILAMAGTTNAAFADQPYIGAYGIDGTTVYNADNTYIRQRFTDDNSDNRASQDVLSVLSLAGSTGGISGVTGFSYQAVIRWDMDTNIYADDQV